MIEVYAIVALTLVAVGVVVGILVVFALGIWREEKDYSLTVASPSRLASGIRAATGASARRPGVSRQVGQLRQDLALAGSNRQPE
jgi:hypothetical protein